MLSNLAICGDILELHGWTGFLRFARDAAPELQSLDPAISELEQTVWPRLGPALLRPLREQSG
jgi:hypothetical protein